MLGTLQMLSNVGMLLGGRGHGNPLQYPCLENPCGQRILVWAIVHGVAKSQT